MSETIAVLQDKYERAVWEYDRARRDMEEAKHELDAAEYASEQGPPDAEEDCSDLG